MKRRQFLRTAGAGTVAALVAGCTATPESNTDTSTETGNGSTQSPSGTTVGTTESPGGTLVVATYSPFIDAPSSSPGAWVKQAFEDEYDATLVWQTPENEINYYIERAAAGVETEADAYVGLNTDHLIRIDQKLDSNLFVSLDDAGIEGRETVKASLEFDPDGRAIPYDTGYVCLVYNENEAVAPETFDGLLEPEYEGQLLAQNPTSSATGRAFLLHTIAAKGADGYLDYWTQLKDNDVRVLGTWSDSYSAYSNGEAAMVVSYSTDQVYASRYGEPMAEHQIRFLNDQAYANPEGMAVFENSDNRDLAERFVEFMLRPEVQAEIAVRNVQFPATTTAELPEDFAQYAYEPADPVTFTYPELKDTVSEWVDQWAQQFASK